MKTILFTLLFLPSVAFAEKGNYTYNAITQIVSGADNFKPSQYEAIEQQGMITVAQDFLKIDDKVLKLKPTNDRKVYRIKGGVVKFIYENSALVSVQLYQYNKAYCFNIAGGNDLASK
ncbi:MAG TPA: hypothetical protein PL009_00855 [Flavipsychrobacter sp.]|nr:hypothetical protein [Flavipsychrobacter sp.]